MDDTPTSAGPLSRPSFVVIGADGWLAARPATPVQVVHACSRAGYDAAVPATWGDELIAARCVERLAERTLAPAVFCACSLVRDRLLAPGPDLLPFMLSFVAPPVATARYLRQLYAGRSIDVTYVGACPSADDEAIDRVVTPVAFFAELRGRGISLSQQPTVFDSVLAPDRRRFASQPGGLPIPSQVANSPVARHIVEIGGFEYAADLAQHLLLSEPVLVDISTRAGCVCAGAAVGVPPLEARRTLVALEPPRSAHPIVEPGVHVIVDLPLAPPPEDDGPDPAFIEPDADRGRDAVATDRPFVERRLAERRRVFDQTFDVQFEAAFRQAFDGGGGVLQRAEPLMAVAERTMIESVLERRRTPPRIAPAPEPTPTTIETTVSIPVVREPARARPRPRPRALRRRPLYNAWRQTARWFRRIPASTYIVSFAAVIVTAACVGFTVRARHTFQLTAQPPR
jgi:hypothetical protein